MEVAFGVLAMTHEEFFALTPFQFVQIYRGWEDREKRDAIKRAELLATLYNVNRWDEDAKFVEVSDLLPWYNEYLTEVRNTQGLRTQEVDLKDPELPRAIDTSIPQIERVTKRLLEQRGIDPEIAHDSEEWREANRVAGLVCGTGEGSGEVEENVKQLQGISIKKADPAVWGEKFPDW